jgi:predicted RNA methylase
MKNKDLLQKNISLFDSDVKGEKNISNGMNKNLLDKILDNYIIKDMNDWKDVNADLIITDPPFGIEFTGKKWKLS